MSDKSKQASSDSAKAVVRMPDGTKVKTEYSVAHTVSFPGAEQEVWVVKCTCNHEVVDKPLFGSFDRGFVKGEIGLYLPSKRMWMFKRTEKTLHELKALCREWLFTHLGNNKTAYAKMVLEMSSAENRKLARKVQRYYYKKYGRWEFGLNASSRTVGYDNLVKRRKDYSQWLTLNPDAEPRIAWKI